MKNTVSNLVNMIRAVILYCTTNTLLSASAFFLAARNAASAKLVIIDGLNQIAVGTTTGVTLNTNAIKKAMIDIAYKCASGLKAFTFSPSCTNPEVLLAKVNYTPTDLERIKKDDIDDICETISIEANANIANSADLLYDASDVTALNAAIALYRTAMQNPRQAIITKSQANKQITEISRSVVDIQFKGIMDNLVNTQRTIDPNYVSGYYQSREIIDLGSTHAKIRGTVQNPTQMVLSGVSVFITPVGQPTVILQTTTDNTGKFTLNQIPAAAYDLHIEYTEGYINQLESNLQITPGKEIKRKITLPFQTIYTLEIPVGEFRVALSPATPVWRPGISLNFKNLNPTITPSSASGYTSYSPTDPGPGSGDISLNSQQDQTVTNIPAPSFKPYLSFANTGTNPVTIQITIL